MNNKKILKKAIDKAVNNGFNHYIDQLNYNDFYINPCGEIDSFECGTCPVHINSIIFSHDFAKAFWGSSKLHFMFLDRNKIAYWWEYHLQQMVLEKKPLKYLEKFLNDK